MNRCWKNTFARLAQKRIRRNKHPPICQSNMIWGVARRLIHPPPPRPWPLGSFFTCSWIEQLGCLASEWLNIWHFYSFTRSTETIFRQSLWGRVIFSVLGVLLFAIFFLVWDPFTPRTVKITILASTSTNNNVLFIISTPCSFIICHFKYSSSLKQDGFWLAGKFPSFIIWKNPSALFLCVIIVKFVVWTSLFS